MKTIVSLSVSLFAATLILSLLSTAVPFARAASPSGSELSGLAPAMPGYAEYRVVIASPTVTRTLTLNESVSASSTPGEDILFLSVTSAKANLTYSRFVNSSDTLQPFIPSISNQTFAFSYNSTRVALAIAQNGTAQVTFQGTKYQLTSYLFSASVASKNVSGTAVGSLFTFPSGLLYSVSSNFNGSLTFRATLLSTSLQLSSSNATPDLQMASVGVGVAAVGGVLLATLGIRSRRHHKQEAAQKPEYWVD